MLLLTLPRRLDTISRHLREYNLEIERVKENGSVNIPNIDIRQLILPTPHLLNTLKTLQAKESHYADVLNKLEVLLGSLSSTMYKIGTPRDQTASLKGYFKRG